MCDLILNKYCLNQSLTNIETNNKYSQNMHFISSTLYISDLLSLRKVIKDRKLEEHTLSIWEIPKIKSLVVSSDKELDKTDAVMFYFEKSTVGGPLESDIVRRTDEGFLILDFKDEKSKFIMQQIITYCKYSSSSSRKTLIFNKKLQKVYCQRKVANFSKGDN